jgi:hypothetical protein
LPCRCTAALGQAQPGRIRVQYKTIAIQDASEMA